MRAAEVIHQPDRRRFVIALDEGEAVLEYRLSQPGGPGATVDFSRTYVPPPQRGKGLAEALVRRGLKWARDEGYEVEASCWYVAKFLRHGRRA